MKGLRCTRAARWGCLLLAVAGVLLGCPASVQAHVGSPTVFYEGAAGPYQTRVTVRPPEVIPGLATVSVRVFSPGVEHVTALPIRWNTGRKGAPPADEALLVQGETNLYSTQLWFMQGGAQSVAVEITGRSGTGKVQVPVNAVATRVLAMPRGLGQLLAALGAILILLLTAVIGAAVRETILPPGTLPGRGRVWLARGAMVGALFVLASLLWLGKRWWDHEAMDYRHNRLYRPLQTEASVRTSPSGPVLQLKVVDEQFFRGPPLVLDHGKLMHLFVVREPGMDVFGHLHPQRLDWRTFDAPLPDLPDGRYSLYGDITYETGFSDTLTAQLSINHSAPPTTKAVLAESDPDDAWRMAPPLDVHMPVEAHSETLRLTNGEACKIEWITGGPLRANRELELQFLVTDPAGHAAVLEPYLGMAGHLVVRREDGTVFTHLHPSGSFSMAAQELFVRRSDGRAPLKAGSATNDPICQLPTSIELEQAARAAWTEHAPPPLTFPYLFPKPGRYRIWLQLKVQEQLLTAVFDADVGAG